MSGSVSASEIKHCSDILLSQYFEEINLNEPKYSNDLVGLVQIFLAFYIIQTELSDEAKNS
jgi:hypothetical protein